MRILHKNKRIQFGLKLKILREQKGFSQEKLANTMGISQSYYNRLENGEAKFTLDRLFVVVII